ncbi:MAG: ATP-binding cassette domain-containing protein [Rhodanobacter sp.]
MNTPGQVVLGAQHIALGYHRRGAPTQEVLRDFSLALRAREIVAVLGPSGVGKSTLISVLAGLQRPDAGTVSVFGETVQAAHPAVGVVFQDPCLLPWRTVRGNVAIGLDFASRAHREAGVQRVERVRAALAEVALAEAGDCYPAELSGGMAQRVALARCLARQPEILLLDEPFAALDAATRAAMQALLLRVVTARRAAVVLVTHDIDEALRLADRVLLLRGQPAVLAGSWTLARAKSGEPRHAAPGLHQEIVSAMTAVNPAAPVVASVRVPDCALELA